MTYRLNKYDVALAMGEILSQQNALYLNYKKFYTSGCFHTRGVPKNMGINAFEQAPSS
jgi:hypothetical protein